MKSFFTNICMHRTHFWKSWTTVSSPLLLSLCMKTFLYSLTVGLYQGCSLGRKCYHKKTSWQVATGMSLHMSGNLQVILLNI